MKTFILSTIAAAALALSAGTALASSNSSDNGFAVYQESLQNTPAADRQFLSSDAGYDHGVSNNAKQSADFRATQTWGR